MNDSANPNFEIGARALGYHGLMASYSRRRDRLWRSSVCITSSCDHTLEGAHIPAQSVTIDNRAGLLALRDVIDEALRQPEPETKGDTP
jgi:hypothetical protein